MKTSHCSTRAWLKSASLVSLATLGACTVPQAVIPEPNDPRFAPVLTLSQPTVGSANGSIYQRGSAVDLYQRRAYRTGDVLTINLNESTSARKSSGTSYSRESSTSVPDVSLFGSTINTATELGSSTDFGGSANSDQSNQLIGNITVTVANVLPNGLLEVRGEKWLQLNKGNEYIRISGLVRGTDISPDNSISSTRVADVRIAYSGTGTLADSNEPGWLSRFFVGNVWPF
ncbi:MAG: flagellar basal body L-ring protein FlgH [Gammaproteobacteria bacterium]|nr:flagellar basal body L-ring protein FlgH [Gammaproteobacteria bacterium]MDP2139338.1 flagellar basal body L-ring protein FlgH [Gammaproteobacteria bacterium]MDP2346895.1 flagellar basal body L-ring protein FlgH [Gammaproteobacteria bacterium]